MFGGKINTQNYTFSLRFSSVWTWRQEFFDHKVENRSLGAQFRILAFSLILAQPRKFLMRHEFDLAVCYFLDITE